MGEQSISAACRNEALKVVLDFAATASLVQVARLVYQLEVLLLHPIPSSGKVCPSKQHAMFVSMPCLQAYLAAAAGLVVVMCLV